MVTQKEFDSIINYIQKQVDIITDEPLNIVRDCTYNEWKKLYNKKIKEELVYSDEYNEWWCTYPTSEKFEYKGRKFTGTRALRDKKEEGYPLYQAARKVFTAEELLTALKCEIEQRKIDSFTHKNPQYNAFHYMKATTAYLRAERYTMWMNEEIPIAKECKEVIYEINI